jgi:hypothetical protein
LWQISREPVLLRPADAYRDADEEPLSAVDADATGDVDAELR